MKNGVENLSKANTNRMFGKRIIPCADRLDKFRRHSNGSTKEKDTRMLHSTFIPLSFHSVLALGLGQVEAGLWVGCCYFHFFSLFSVGPDSGSVWFVFVVVVL